MTCSPAGQLTNTSATEDEAWTGTIAFYTIPQFVPKRLKPVAVCVKTMWVVLGCAVVANGAETATIYRDSWGVPNIYADSEEAGCFAGGYAQAEDRLEQMFDNYRMAIGRMSEIHGPNELFNDFRARVWRHAEISKENYPKVSAKARACIEAFLAGVRHYMKEHPDKVPANALTFEPWMCVALGRAAIFPWPEMQAAEKLIRAGAKPQMPGYRGSNEMVLGPSRTRSKVPIAVIDPHMTFYGPVRYYEGRVYAGQVKVAGGFVRGTPLPGFGHNEYISMAHTTGGPDTADVFVETLNPDNPRQYQYDGQWRDGVIERIEVAVRNKEGKIDTVTQDVLYTHHGPVVATKDGKGYAVATPYFDQVALGDMAYKVWLSKNVTEFRAALAMAQYHPQNVMVACVDGDIYYQRTGRVPIRPDGIDYSRPVPGNTSQTEWRGIHSTDDLVQILNPPCGWMQNCNISPRVMFRDSPLTEDKYKSYLYMEPRLMGVAYGLHQRAAMVFQLLDELRDATVEDVFEIATSPRVYGVRAWQERLRTAWEKGGDAMKNDAELARFARAILNWNGRAEKDSVGVVCYHYWKQAQSFLVRQADKVGAPPPRSMSDDEVFSALKAALKAMKDEHGRLDVTYGDIFRVGRKGGNRTAPADGGSIDGIATPRAMWFEPMGKTKQRLATGGQSALMVVEMTSPPRSWTAAPLGQSDDPKSPHFDDQALKLVAHRKLKSTYFMDKAALLKDLESKTELTWKP